MPLTVSVGLSQKVGQPDYGSIGASCNIQIELDSTLLTTDPVSFQRQIANAYGACREAVNTELARHQTGEDPQSTQESHSTGQTNGSRATSKQLEYARQLAGQIQGLGVRRLDELAGKMFGKPVADLTTLDASSLIDTLKQIKAGHIQLDHALNESAA
jgi:hypothetical protein